MSLRLLFSACLVVLLALGSSGCFVFEELDSGMDYMKKREAARNGKKAGAEVASAKAPGQAGKEERPSAAEWWKKARSLSSGELDESIVTCRLGGSTQFMRRTDCEARGGRAG